VIAESTLVGHQIAKEGRISIVDIRTIEFDDLSEFLHDCGSSGFDPEDVGYLHTAAGIRPSEMHAFDAHDGFQVDAIGFQRPLLLIPPLGATFCCDDLVVFLKKDSFNPLDATQTYRIQYRVLQLTQEDVFELSSLQMTNRSVLKLSAILPAAWHCKFAIDHFCTVELEAKEPWDPTTSTHYEGRSPFPDCPLS